MGTKYKIKNLTYQPLRLLTVGGERILKSRQRKGETIVDELTDQIKSFNTKEFIRISVLTEKKKRVYKKRTEKEKPMKKDKPNKPIKPNPNKPIKPSPGDTVIGDTVIIGDTTIVGDTVIIGDT